MELTTKFVESFSSEPTIRKYSYLDHSYYIYTIYTLEGWHSHTNSTDPRVPAPVGGVGGQNLGHL